MSSSLRMDNNLFYNAAAVVLSENSNAVDVGGSRGYSVLVTLTDNGSGAGTIALQGSLDGTNFVEITGTLQTIAFATPFLYTVIDPMYKHVRLAVVRSAGSMDITGEITVIEGGY